MIMLAAAFVSLNSFAHELYVGNIKGKTTPCSLEIEQVYYVNNQESPENLRADIVLSLEDDHHHKMVSHGEEFFFTVKSSANPLIFDGIGQNQKDQVNLVTTDGTLKTLSMYAVKWLHTSHFHSAHCVNLKYVAH